MAQRTLYDANLPAGQSKRKRDALLDAIAEQFPDADVQLIAHKPATGPRAYRIIAVAKPKGSK